MANSKIGTPLDPVSDTEDDDGLGPADKNEDELDPQTNLDRENQASSEAVDPGKFRRD